MIYRIYPAKDTWITNDIRSCRGSAVRQTGSNVGQAEELDVFKKSPVSGVIGTLGTSSLGRVLLQWDFSQYSALTASFQIPSTGSSYWLHVSHKTGGGPLPYSFDMTISPVSATWDEGRGMDVEELADVGAASWVYRQQGLPWTNQGGDYLSSPTATLHFDTGYEDVDLDLTSIVGQWLTGGLVNNGIGISMTGSIESDLNFNDYYTKRFYSRQTSYPDRVPFIEVRVKDFIPDDRANMAWGETGSIFLYNVRRGQYADLSALPVVTVADVSGNIVVSMTASHVSLGIYSASFSAASSSIYSGSLFYDAWKSAGVSLMTSSFGFSSDVGVPYPNQSQLTARVRNLKTEYSPDEIVRFEVLFRRSPNSVSVVQTASLGVPPYIVPKGYFAIDNDATRQRVIAFLTASDETRLSYDGSGNYFNFHMSNLQSGNVYRIVFLVDEIGMKRVVDQDIRFKVV